MKVAIVVSREMGSSSEGFLFKLAIVKVFIGNKASAKAKKFVEDDLRAVEASEKRAAKGNYDHYHPDQNLEIEETEAEVVEGEEDEEEAGSDDDEEDPGSCPGGCGGTGGIDCSCAG